MGTLLSLPRFFLTSALLYCFSLSACADPAASLAALQGNADFRSLKDMPGVTFDLRYATSNNFTATNLYGDFNQAFLHKIAADKLALAAAALQSQHPGYKFLIFDATRPRSVQQKLWERVRGTDKQRYVADPTKGSIHNYGFAVDLSIVDAEGKELDMGSAFDSFAPISQPVLEQGYLQKGELSETQLAHRKLLRKLMQDAGFIQLPLEWWHFDALPSAEVHKLYKIIE